MISALRLCNCIGPQNGEPMCPCMMNAHKRNREKLLKEFSSVFTPNTIAPQTWECPRCHKIHGPSSLSCDCHISKLGAVS